MYWKSGTLLVILTLSGCGGSEESAGKKGPDPLAGYAWHLKNTGASQAVIALDGSDSMRDIDANVAGVHLDGSGKTGRGVSIALIDSGLEIKHEDLKPNVLLDHSFNFNSRISDPSPNRDRQNVYRFDHGTAVAGIAAAKGWNSLGSRGLAPDAQLMAYVPLNPKVRNTDTLDTIQLLRFGAADLHRGLHSESSAEAEAIRKNFGKRAASVDIFNFSAGTDWALPIDEPAAPDLITLAMEYGTQNMRSGKGATYFLSAGNGFIGTPGGVMPDRSRLEIHCEGALRTAGIISRFSNSATDLSCLDGNFEVSGMPYAMKVAAISADGIAATYSTAGVNNWITGFGGEFAPEKPALVTTDDSGCDVGSNSEASKKMLPSWLIKPLERLKVNLFGSSQPDPGCNYTAMVNGTSAAAPTVAGVAALMLEANPNLSWLDVRYILAKTARLVDPTIAKGVNSVTYTPEGARQALVLNDPWRTNSAGFHFQTRYGFGLVDAGAAVAMASSYMPPAGRRKDPVKGTSLGSLVVTSLSPELGQAVAVERSAVFDRGGEMVSGPIQVDFVWRNTTRRNINPGTLQFELRNSSTGARSILVPAYTAWYAGGLRDSIRPYDSQPFRFFTNAFYGDKLGGTWTLKVVLLDGVDADYGSISSRTLSGLQLVSHAF